MGADRQDPKRPTADASIAELTAWVTKGKAVEVRETRQVPVIAESRKQDRREAPGRPARSRLPAAWQIAVGGIALFVIGQFIASMLAMLAVVALGVGLVAGAFALGRYSARR